MCICNNCFIDYLSIYFYFIFLSLSLSPPLPVIPELTANTIIASTALIGDSITLHCSITGAGLKYTWSRQDGVPLSTLETPTLYNVTYDSAGVYQCTASNLAGNETQIHNVTIQGKRVGGEWEIKKGREWERESKT